MKNNSAHVVDRAWQVAPIFLVVLIQSWRGYFGQGWTGINLVYLLWLVIGWIVGWLMLELDHVFYTLMNNPQELTSQRVKAELANKNWKGMWSLLNDTREERTKLPIRNVLTMFVLVFFGIWTTTSGVHPFGVGITYALGIGLVSEFIRDINWKRWYWVFARGFSEVEHRMVIVGLVVMMVIQTLFLWR